MAKIIYIIAFSVFFILIAAQIRSSLVHQAQLSGQFRELEEKINKAELDQKNIENNLKFYSDPINLEKELRSRFNYRDPGEKLIIIVPKNQTSSSAGTNQ